MQKPQVFIGFSAFGQGHARKFNWYEILSKKRHAKHCNNAHAMNSCFMQGLTRCVIGGVFCFLARRNPETSHATLFQRWQNHHDHHHDDDHHDDDHHDVCSFMSLASTRAICWITFSAAPSTRVSLITKVINMPTMTFWRQKPWWRNAGDVLSFLAPSRLGGGGQKSREGP